MSEREEEEIRDESEESVSAEAPQDTLPVAALEAGNEDEAVALETAESDVEAAAEESETELVEGASRERLDGIVESVLFAIGAPVPLKRLTEILKGPTAKEIKAALARLKQEYGGRERGIHLLEVGGGFQFRTAPENSEWVRAALRERPARLGRAALETLAIIAYKQPATRAEIEAIRGVDADAAIGSLLGKRLIKIAGRKETVGRPLMYTTTPEFLEAFGLKDLSELPALKEIGPAPEPEEEDDASIEDGEWRATAEDPQPGGGELTADGGGDDPRRTGEAEREGGDGAGDEGGPEPRSDHG
jgi:segregation and condensation protein B